MKTFLVFLLGLVLGAAALHFYRAGISTPAESVDSDAPAAPEPETTPDAQAPPPRAYPTPAMPEPKDESEPSLADRARGAAERARDSISDQLERWDLTPEDIKRDFAATGRVIRTKARDAGERIQDARIVSVIKGKYVLDGDLSALDIQVSSTDGFVVLRGTVTSPELVGRATRLALETDGVVQVDAELYAPPPEAEPVPETETDTLVTP